MEGQSCGRDVGWMVEKEEENHRKEYLTTQLYIVERANACSEFISRGRHEKMVAVFDFSTSSSDKSATRQHSPPPIQWQVSAIRKVPSLYPERLYRLLLVEPPLWVRAIYHTLRRFLPTTTQEKIRIIADRYVVVV